LIGSFGNEGGQSRTIAESDYRRGECKCGERYRRRVDTRPSPDETVGRNGSS
jgi:hypothetical protein